MILARPIPLPQEPHRYLLQRDVEIPMDLVPRLRELGIWEVWIRHRDLEFIEQLIDEEVGEQQRQLYSAVRRNFENIMRGAAGGLEIHQFESAISDLFSCLRSNRQGNILLQKLDAFDCYLMSHSTNVCYLALLLGMKLERYLIDQRPVKHARDAKDLRQLGLGCLLHDVGKMRIPAEILNKPGRVTDEEFEVLKKHTELGYEMLGGQVPAAAAQVVLHHHQRWDGKGYPQRIDHVTGERLPPLSGRQIPVFCRIATLADVYDAATSKRSYSDAKPSVMVLHEMRTVCKGMFDPACEAAFYEIIPPFPIGKIVKLSDGVEAAVVDFNPQQPHRPKIQCLRDPYGQRYDDPSLEEIDLALYPEVEIVEIDHIDVRPFAPNRPAPVPAPSFR